MIVPGPILALLGWAIAAIVVGVVAAVVVGYLIYQAVTSSSGSGDGNPLADSEQDASCMGSGSTNASSGTCPASGYSWLGH